MDISVQELKHDGVLELYSSTSLPQQCLQALDLVVARRSWPYLDSTHSKPQLKAWRGITHGIIVAYALLVTTRGLAQHHHPVWSEHGGPHQQDSARALPSRVTRTVGSAQSWPEVAGSKAAPVKSSWSNLSCEAFLVWE